MIVSRKASFVIVVLLLTGCCGVTETLWRCPGAGGSTASQATSEPFIYGPRLPRFFAVPMRNVLLEPASATEPTDRGQPTPSYRESAPAEVPPARGDR